MKKLLKLIGVILMVLSLVACSGQSSNNESTGTTEGGEVDYSQELIIYTNSASGGRGEWLVEKAKEAGFNIQMVQVPGGELTDRVIAEKNNAIADMVYGINVMDMNKLKAQDLLIQFTPVWIDKIDKSLADSEGYYNPVFVQPLILIGNPDVDVMPNDWTELGEQYTQKYALHGLTGGTGRAILGSIISRYLDENGELGVSEEGWKVVEAYIKGNNALQGGQDMKARILDPEDEVQYGMMWASGALQGQKDYDVKFKVMAPEIGVPFVTEQTAILNTSKKQELAKEFINWFGSAEILEEYSANFGSIPANNDSKVGEDIEDLLSIVKPQDLDWELIGSHLDEWVEKVELEYVQ